MPDILLLPELCSILGISVDLLLEIPEDDINEGAVTNFCRYASANGKSRALLNAFSRLFGDEGNTCKRGYLQGDAMAGIYMILAGCQVLSDSGAINGYKRFARISENADSDKL